MSSSLSFCNRQRELDCPVRFLHLKVRLDLTSLLSCRLRTIREISKVNICLNLPFVLDQEAQVPFDWSHHTQLRHSCNSLPQRCQKMCQELLKSKLNQGFGMLQEEVKLYFWLQLCLDKWKLIWKSGLLSEFFRVSRWCRVLLVSSFLACSLQNWQFVKAWYHLYQKQ